MKLGIFATHCTSDLTPRFMSGYSQQGLRWDAFVSTVNGFIFYSCEKGGLYFVFQWDFNQM